MARELPNNLVKGQIVKFTKSWEYCDTEVEQAILEGQWFQIVEEELDSDGDVGVYSPFTNQTYYGKASRMYRPRLTEDEISDILEQELEIPPINARGELITNNQAKNKEPKMSKEIVEIATGNAKKSVKIVSQVATGHVILTNTRKFIAKKNPMVGAMLTTKYGKLAEGVLGVIAPTLVEAYRPDDKRLMWAAEALQQTTAAAGGFEAGEAINELLDAVFKGVKTPYDED